MTSTNGSTFTESPYRTRTGDRLRGGTVYRSTQDFMINASGTAASSGTWAQSLDNPAFPDTCGLSVALVLDLSYSVAIAGAEDDLRAAATSFTEALIGTPSEVALFTFGTTAPAGGANNANRPLTPVSTAGGAAVVTDWIDGITVPSSPAEYTNWDRGLFQVAQSLSTFDVAIVLTDGLPTRHGANPVPPSGGGTPTRFVEVEHAIFSANAIKSEGTRVIAVGVGDGVSGDPANLIAISGQTNGAASPAENDYYQAGWEQVGEVLQEVALAGCEGSVTVVKQIVPVENEPGDTAGAVPAHGWTFDASTANPGVSITGDDGVTGLPTASAVTQIGTGAASFGVDGIVGEATVTLAERPQGGYHHFPLGEDNAVCTRLAGGPPGPLDVVSTEGSAAGEFSVDLGPTDVVSCVVYNQPDPVDPPQPATLLVDKVWEVVELDDEGEEIPGTLQTFANGAQPPQFAASFGITDITDPGNPIEHPNLSWGFEYTGLVAGQVGEFDEEVQYPAACTLTSALVTEHWVDPDGPGPQAPEQLPPPNGGVLPFEDTLQAGANRYVVTNRLACEARLSLHKVVANGTPPADPALWTLHAVGPDGALPGPEGSYEEVEGVRQPPTAVVSPRVPYALSESGGDPNYIQVTAPADPIQDRAIGSTGSWVCADADEGGALVAWRAEGVHGSVTLTYGDVVHCLTINVTSELTVFKFVTGGPASEADWTFSVQPVDPPVTLPGYDDVAAGATVNVRPEQLYRVAENPGPPGYELTGLYCVWDAVGGGISDGELLDDPTVAIAPVGAGLCEFRNEPRSDVTIEKTHSTLPDPLTVGDTFDYVLTVENEGAVPAEDVVVADDVPAGLEVLEVQIPDDAWTDESDGNQVRVTTPSFPPGTAEIRITAEVVAVPDDDAPFVNEACVAATNDIAPDDDCASVVVPPPVEPPTPPVPPVDPPPGPPLPNTGSGVPAWLVPLGLALVLGGAGTLLRTGRIRLPRRG